MKDVELAILMIVIPLFFFALVFGAAKATHCAISDECSTSSLKDHQKPKLEHFCQASITSQSKCFSFKAERKFNNVVEDFDSWIDEQLGGE